MIHRAVRPRFLSAYPHQLKRQRQHLSLSPSGVIALPSSRCFSSEFEDRYHLANQLSRPTENAKSNQTKWTESVKKINRNKGHDWYKSQPITGLQHYTPAKYEHDGLAEIQSRSWDAPVLLEIRDVRVPASSHHPSFTRLAKHRVHLICYTHADLIDAPARDRVERWTGRIWPESMCLFLDTREGRGKDSLEHFDRLYDGLLDQLEGKGSNAALTVGVPNVGKSCVLMALLRYAREKECIPRKIKVNANANNNSTSKNKGKGKIKKKMVNGGMPGILDTPGKTREISEYLLRESPRAYFLDVPGITPPSFFFESRPEAWYGYGATNLLPLNKFAKEDVEVHRAFCDYVLYCANRDEIFHYVDRFQLDGPTDDIDEMLPKLSNKFKDKLGSEELMLKRCQTFLTLFNTGNFGPLILDDLSDDSWEPFQFSAGNFSRKG